MPLRHTDPPLNPTVEEVCDETETHSQIPGSDFRSAWPELCTQHESVLSAHLRMLQALKGQITSDAESSKLIQSMLERTNKLCMQFEGIKKHVIHRMNRNPVLEGYSGDFEKVDLRAQASARSDDGSRPKRRKRQRVSNEVEQESEMREPVISEFQRSKRKRVDVPNPTEDQDVGDAVPVSFETEDISEEVQRRLKIKEEKRKRREVKPEKRKRDRDSLASNASTSSLASMKPRKRFKLSEPTS
ncbi:hypothetical protein BJX99DRAFT_232542 [Aspergillus californicus]